MMFRKSGNQGLGIRKSVDQGIGGSGNTACLPLSAAQDGTGQKLGLPTSSFPLPAPSFPWIKRVIRVVLALLIIIPNFALAQKLGHIDSEYVLNKMPEYAEKKSEIDQLAKDYQKEVQGMLSEVEAMRADLRAKEVLYTAEMKKEREVEIEKKAQEALEKQTKLFGFEGLLFKKQEELLKPFLQKLWEAVESVARQKKLDYILDKASDVGIIYSNPVHDYTEYVLEELGLLEKEN